MADLGTDWRCGPGGLDPHGEIIGGAELVAQALANRITTPRGRLRRHPNYGIDLRELVSSKIDRARLYAIRSQVAAECRKDERVSALSVETTVDDTDVAGAKRVRIAISGRCAAGPFDFVVEASALSVEVIWPKGGA